MPTLEPTGSAANKLTDANAAESQTSGPTELLRFVPRPDPVLAQIGHDPRSAYAERFWLSTLGPSALWILRLLAHGFEAAPTGFTVDAGQFSRSLGLGERTGKHSPLLRSLDRLAHFTIVKERVVSHHQAKARTRLVYEVTTQLRWLDGHQLRRLPPDLRAEHELWEQAFDREHPLLASTRRGAVCARSLAKSDLTADEMTRSLERIGIEPELAVELADWAMQRRHDTAPRQDHVDVVTVTAAAADVASPAVGLRAAS